MSMGRNISSNRCGYNIRAKLYPSLIDDNNEVVRKLVFTNATVFYARDYQDFIMQQDETSGAMRRIVQKGSIETMDLNASDIKPYDTVEYQGKKYNVEDIRIIDDNAQKEVSNRPIIKTIIKLGAIVND